MGQVRREQTWKLSCQREVDVSPGQGVGWIVGWEGLWGKGVRSRSGHVLTGSKEQRGTPVAGGRRDGADSMRQGYRDRQGKHRRQRLGEELQNGEGSIATKKLGKMLRGQ